MGSAAAHSRVDLADLREPEARSPRVIAANSSRRRGRTDARGARAERLLADERETALSLPAQGTQELRLGGESETVAPLSWREPDS